MSFVKQREPMLRDDPTLPSELRAAFAGYGDVAPSSAAREALFVSLERTLATTPVARSRYPRFAPWLVGLLLLGVIAAGVVWSVQPSALPVSPTVQTPVMPPVVAMPAPVHSVVQTAVSPVEQTVPQTEARAAVRSRVRSRVQSARRAEVARDPAAELLLLTRAKRVLPSDAATALALTHEHRATFPSGTFTQEREVIAIEALVRVGDTTAARARAAAFRSAYPQSAHLERLRVVLAEP